MNVSQLPSRVFAGSDILPCGHRSTVCSNTCMKVAFTEYEDILFFFNDILLMKDLFLLLLIFFFIIVW